MSKSRLKFKLGKGHKQLVEHINNLQEVFTVKKYRELLGSTGETIKANVETNIIKSKAMVTGNLLRAIQNEDPNDNIHVVENTRRRTRVLVGVGDMYVLNKIVREPRTVTVTLYNAQGDKITRQMEFIKRGTVPYWVILEFGSLGWADTPPPFIKHPRKASSNYRMRFWGWENTSGGKKPVISMVPAKYARSWERPHPGVRPRRPFRRALRTVAIRYGSLENRLLTEIRRALS